MAELKFEIHPTGFSIDRLLTQARLDAIEECARECDEWAETERKLSGHKERIFAYRNAAAAIRALKDK